MKLQRQLSKGKLWSAVRNLLIFVPRKKPSMLSACSAVAAKCREFWEGLTGGGLATARGHANDYFKGNYEFSCTNTPMINFLGKSKSGRGRRRRPPCIGDKQAQEMLKLECIARGKEWSPERSPPGAGAENEIDGLAEEFIRRFYEQLRMQSVEELQVEY